MKKLHIFYLKISTSWFVKYFCKIKYAKSNIFCKIKNVAHRLLNAYNSYCSKTYPKCLAKR